MPEPYRLLVVDDDVIALEVVQDHLEGEPFVIEKATDWTSMSEILFCERPEVILLDLNLPGVTGDSIATIIHDTVVPRPSVVLHSGKDPAEIAAVAERVQAFAWLAKGCAAMDMVDTLKKAGEACRRNAPPDLSGDSGMRRSTPPPRPEGFGSSAPPSSGGPRSSAPGRRPLEARPGSAVPDRAPLPPTLDSVPPSMGSRPPLRSRDRMPGSDFRGGRRGEDLRVLVAAPPTAARSMIQSRLVGDGITVLLAGSWRETLSVLTREPVGVLLLASGLEGISPIRLKHTLEKRAEKRPKILLWTEVSPDVSRQLYLDLDADGLVSTELSPTALAEAIHSSLDSSLPPVRY